MKKINNYLVGASMVIFALFLNSCSSTVEVAKKRYSPGYYVSISNSKNASSEVATAETKNFKAVTGTVESVSAHSVVNNASVANQTISLDEMNAVASTENVATTHNVILNKEVLNNVKKVESKGVVAQVKAAKEMMKAAKATSPSSPFEVSKGLLYLLAILIPFVAVGLATDWDITKVVINLVLCILCGIPGIIHALIVVSKS